MYVICLTPYIYTYIVRLVNGGREFEGRVEVYYNGEWGTVCDDRWDLNDAQVICRELGFGRTIAARNGAYYGMSIGEIWLDELNCNGTELMIEDCSHDGWGNEDCSHREDAGVECSDGNFYLLCTTYIIVIHLLYIFSTSC